MSWKPKKPKWEWRKFLTVEESDVLKRSDEAKAAWLALNKERAAITNRAIQRAKHHHAKGNAYCRRIYLENIKYGGMP